MKKNFVIKKSNIITLALFLCIICGIAYIGIYASEQNKNGTSIKKLSDDVEATPGPVSVEYINYDEDKLSIQLNGNSKVYYSDSNQKVWNAVEGNKDEKGTEDTFDDTIEMDMSWISPKTDYELYIKGSEDDSTEMLEIPGYNGSIKVKFDAVEGKLEFDNDDAAPEFEWRKATSYNWNTVNIEQNELRADDKAFLDEIEQLRLKGGKIIVRIPAKNGVATNLSNGTKDLDIGMRQSKEVTVSITKRANAVNAKINIKKFTISTQKTMEYRIDSIGGVAQENQTWKDCDANMEIKDMAPQTLYDISGENTKEVIVEIRKQATAKAGHSKSMYLTIPAQEKAPAEGSLSRADKKILVTFSLASKSIPYEYAVVKEGSEFDPLKASWKVVKEKKTVIFQEKSLPNGSAIYIRKSGVAATSTKVAQFPSAYRKIDVTTTVE